MHLTDVLLKSSIESRVQVSNNKVEVAYRVCLDSMGCFLDLRLNFFQDICHHIKAGLIRVSAMGQMAINKAEGPLIERKLNVKATFVAKVTSHTKSNIVLTSTVHEV
jgi:hypothetical protein